jgi:hypothetical protein
MAGMADDSSGGRGPFYQSFEQGPVMSEKRRRSKPQAQPPEPVKPGRKALLNYLLAFAFGLVITGGVAMLIAQGGKLDTYRPNGASRSPGIAGHRTVADLMALSDPELEQIDVIEMNVAVAPEIPGLESLDYDKYRQIVDGWTKQFRGWLPTVEHAFYERPEYFKNDIHFFRLGMLAPDFVITPRRTEKVSESGH